MNSQGDLNLLFRPGLRKDFRDDYTAFDPQYTSFLRTDTIKLPEISATVFTGPNRLYEMGDGEDPAFESLLQGPKVAAVDKEFGLGILVTRKTIEDDQYGKASQAGKHLASAARLTDEFRSAGLLDDAFAGSLYKGIDGLALCVNNHTFLNASGTWSNIPTSPVGFSMTGVNAMLDIFMTTKDHNGDPIRMMPDKVIIGNNSGDFNRSIQIFGSDKDPFTANNADNAIKKRMSSPKVIVSVYKSSSKSYFMQDSKWNDAWFLRRRPVTFKDWRDEKSENHLAKVDTRFLIWFVDPRGWAGANPS
jgi:hypothetical protein